MRKGVKEVETRHAASLLKEDENEVLLLLERSVAALETVHTSCRIDELALARVEGVGGVGDFKLDQRIGLAFELDGFLGGYGGAAQEAIAIGHVLEDNRAIIVRMNTFFHIVY